MACAFRDRAGYKLVSEDVHLLAPESASSPQPWRQITWQLGNIPMHVRKKSLSKTSVIPPAPHPQMAGSVVSFLSAPGEVKKQDEGSLAFTNEEAQKLLI